MAETTLKIDGIEVTVSSGVTIMTAARQAGINIPSMCEVESRTSEVPCGLCVVAVAGLEQPVRACATLAAAGQVVTTESPALKKIRQQRLAFFAATHFGDCKAPCNLTCPGQINVQGYIAHVAKGQYEEATRLIMERNPLPFSVGRVCPRFCETRCRRLLVDEPVSINHLKRFVADWCMANKVDLKIAPDAPTGKAVAVIGGGPAGLTAAYFLAGKGHDVTVFEAAPKLGGMLRYGLPKYKIPEHVLDYEINTILRLGISVRFNQRWGKDFSIQDLKNRGFAAILITGGADVDEPLSVLGETLPQVLPALKFLRDLREGRIGNYGRRAAVFGGNNVAMEAALSLLRAGVDQVTVIYPRAKTEMPANQRNIKEAEREGVQFLLMALPVQIDQAANGLEVELIRTKLGEPYAKGFRYPEAIPGSNIRLHADTVIAATGQMACAERFAGGNLEDTLELTPKNNIKANPRTSLTNHEGVYVAGDAATGPRSVIQAVVGGRRAAANIHAKLTGEARDDGESRFNFTRGKGFDDVDLRNFDGIHIKLREKMPERPPEIGIQDTFGSGAMTNSIADTQKTDLFLMIGSNPDTSHPTIGLRVHQALDRGARLIVVDPRKTRLAERAGLWLRIKPGTDVAFLNGVMHIILEEDLWDKQFVQERTEDFDELRQVMRKYNPAYVSGLTGLSEDELRRCARMYAGPGRHAIFHGMGITHYATGTDRVKSIANLAMLCGKVGVEGGGCNPLRGQNNVQGACDMGALFNTLPGYGGLDNEELFDRYEKLWKIKLPRRPGKPATEVWENIIKGDIRGLYVFGEDPALADANIGHVQEALKEVDFLVVQDIFLTDTARAADVVLPAACFAEKDGTFTCTERRVQRVRKAVEPPGEAKPDWRIFCELSKKMGYVMNYSSAEEIFEEVRKLLPQYVGITYGRLDQLGLQWPVPNEDHPGTPVLHTEKFTRGRGLFVPEDYIPPREPADQEYPMLFTTGREYARYNFSSMTGKTPEIDAIAPECLAEINPVDAERMRIGKGSRIRISSRRGSVEMRAIITDRSQEGTILTTYNYAETPVNLLTLDALDRLSRTPEYKLCAVKVEVLD